MNENKNILKLVIPIVAIIIILESVILVNNLFNKKQALIKNMPSNEKVVVVENNQESLDLVFATESKEMVIGKSYPVELNMISNTNKSVDSIGLYISYDPTAFEVTNLSYDSKLPKPNFSKVSSQTKLIVVNYLIQEQNGFKVGANNEIAVAKFNVRPKKIGSFSFEINTGNDNKESATMFIESATGKVLPFSSNKLTVTTNAK